MTISADDPKYRLIGYDNELHIFPRDDFDHEYSKLCECGPYQDPVNIIRISKGEETKKCFIHRPMKKDQEPPK